MGSLGSGVCEHSKRAFILSASLADSREYGGNRYEWKVFILKEVGEATGCCKVWGNGGGKSLRSGVSLFFLLSLKFQFDVPCAHLHMLLYSSAPCTVPLDLTLVSF